MAKSKSVYEMITTNKPPQAVADVGDYAYDKLDKAAKKLGLKKKKKKKNVMAIALEKAKRNKKKRNAMASNDDYDYGS